MSMDQAPTSPAASRPRPRSRGFSYASNKTAGSKNESKYDGSPQDKARRDSFYKGLSKANPNAAMTEEQPAEANAHEQSTIANLRGYQHRDMYGNPIADPDLSNPTRPRMERPLDTIRNFEKAIDDGYKRRSTYIKQDSEQWDKNNQFASRPNSYFNGEYLPTNKSPRVSANPRPAGYDSGPSPTRYGQQQQGGYYGGQNGHGSNGGPPSRMRYGNRMQSDPQFYGQQRSQPQHAYHQSHDTVNTANGSDSTGPWANSTDPSSENSSLDRVNAMNKPQPDGYGGYGPNGYNGPIQEEQGQSGEINGYGQQGGYPQQQQNGLHGAQQNGGYAGGRPEGYARRNTAPHEGSPRRPIPLGGSPGGPTAPPHGQLPVQSHAEPEKKKNRLSKMFSRSKD
ncbi:hypothetical protein LTR37_004630 [Vermiconidia calcicola]|uniref:Uncharacterized protein n=1 Tax=Vermiconidia calcicola TaxID=1690605 RepID=A0ACC3NLU8_9PEZI|nr:hypothetical protein LTR37_004630 [Vermiconidia calcicola]